MEIYYFESVPNTNTALLDLSKKGAKSWTVCWTTDQTQGRGYAGNEWKTEEGKNIAVSFLINRELSYKELICFNQWVCNTICRYLSEFSDEVFAKWPNDVIIRNKKVCGILIETYKSENQLSIVVGIGLNINQNNYSGLPKAGSLFTQTGKEYNIEEILSGLLTEMESSFKQIENKEWKTINLTYNHNLFRLSQVSTFLKDHREFKGIIRGVDEHGRLAVEDHLGRVHFYQHKEIELKY